MPKGYAPFNVQVLDGHLFVTFALQDAAKHTVAAPRLRGHLRRLRQRIVALDTAMILGALAGASTCGAAFSLFVGALRSAEANGLSWQPPILLQGLIDSANCSWPHARQSCSFVSSFSASIQGQSTRRPRAVGRDEPKTNTSFGNGSFRPETFGRIRAQKADKPAILLPQTVLSHSQTVMLLAMRS